MKTMKITTFAETYGHPLTIGELVKGFKENTATGEVTSMNGLLNIRPPYQREFVYENERQKAVIATILENCPLSVIYLAKLDDGKLEVIDGQQRILSICKYAAEQYSIEIVTEICSNKTQSITYSRLAKEYPEKQKDFDNYELMAYVCEGDDTEKMKWFRRINKAGLELTDQELLNANYNGTWVTDAKKYFSNPKGLAFSTEIDNHIFSDYTDAKSGSKSEDEKAVVRQYLLEKVLKWACDAENKNRPLLTRKARFDTKDCNVEEYMGKHRYDRDAIELWRYYEDVIRWVIKVFPTYRKLMQGIEWGLLYNRFKDVDATGPDNKVTEILETEEISNEKAVYEAVLSGNMNLLQARAFPEADRKRKYREQDGMCANPNCPNHGKRFDFKDMAGDHIIPWSRGGKTVYENLQMLCKACNAAKSDCSPIDEDETEED